jgi:hypothetical protein
MKHLMKGMTEIEKQLHQLYKEMNRMIEEGDQAPANDMIEAKYKSVKGQFESGIQGMEQAAMLDVLAQLCMSLGKAEEVACLLSEVCGYLSLSMPMLCCYLLTCFNYFPFFYVRWVLCNRYQ